MKTRHLVFALSGSAALVATGCAHAGFVELDMVTTSMSGRWVHRLYAVFNDPSDAVYYWGTGTVAGHTFTAATAGTPVIRNVNMFSGLPGGGFLNAAPNGSNSLPTSSPGGSPLDSYYTVGTDWQDYPQTGDTWLFNLGMPSLGNALAPGSPTLAQIGNGGVISTIIFSNAATGHQPNPAWSAGSLHDGRADAVLLAQFVTAECEAVMGTIGLTWYPQGNHTQPLLYASDLIFATDVPAPGGLALATWAIVMHARRRGRRPATPG